MSDPNILLDGTFLEKARPQDIQTALHQGADPNAQDEHERTVLMCATIANPNPKVIAALIEAGADIQAQTSTGKTVLMTAAWFSENPKVISTLLKAGAPINTTNQEGKTALDYAEKRAKIQKRKQIIQTLRKAGAKNGKEL